MKARQRNFLESPPPGISRASELAIGESRKRSRRPPLRRELDRELRAPKSWRERFDEANRVLLQERCVY